MPFGELTKCIYRRIAMDNGQPVSSRSIVDFISKRREELGLPPVHMGKQVKSRLKTLFGEGRLIRHHPPKTQDYGWWSLPHQATQDIQIPDDGLEYTLEMLERCRHS
jgi:hypothetical protein